MCRQRCIMMKSWLFCIYKKNIRMQFTSLAQVGMVVITVSYCTPEKPCSAKTVLVLS